METYLSNARAEDSLEGEARIVGRVQVQYVRCGKPTCHCSSGELHGPYFYRTWRDGMKTRKVYVKSDEVEAIRLACDRNAEYKQVLRELRDQRRRLASSIRQEWRRTRAILASVAKGFHAPRPTVPAIKGL